MADEHAYSHIVFTVTRGKLVFLNEKVDAAFKRLVNEIACEKQCSLVELETMPNHAHPLLEKAPGSRYATMARCSARGGSGTYTALIWLALA
ncbi:MAG: transposase [Ktedonobacterales bacterium]|nr:transposase [Ktedonobacterales bacterium]